MIRRMSPSLTTVQVTAVRSRERRGEEKRGAERRGDSPSPRYAGRSSAREKDNDSKYPRFVPQEPLLSGGGEESLQRSEERRVSKSKN
jgi:hypothetical protein